MSFGKHFDFEGSMSEPVEGGAALAWRLLATLEGGSLILAASALLAYTARNRIASRGNRRPIRSVLLTDTTNSLGRELKMQLESRGCVVRTLMSGAESGTTSGVGSGQRVDALVVVGAESKAGDLNAMACVVNEDVYKNLKLLETLSPLVRRGGCVAWACAGAGAESGNFSQASAAFDTVLRASLEHIAKVTHCDPVWVGRHDGAERTADRLVDALLNCTTDHNTSVFSIRNVAHKVGEYVCRWLKIVS
ncbi:hypothetical protein O3G_MSEX002030 [Manduca sexta]|uniref:Uncharacterized protein n=1 Tax=Manduca sexta TaxID=7130 RepID=A0A921YMN7_MANSE|nr:hypothetical protein O3G_MSEX002030 [Manduca sexta]